MSKTVMEGEDFCSKKKGEVGIDFFLGWSRSIFLLF